MDDLTVQFEQLGDTAEYDWIRPLESVLLYDNILCIDRDIGLEKVLTVTELEWDPIRRKVTGIRLSNITGAAGRTVTGFNVQNNSITPAKLTEEVTQEIVGQVQALIPDYTDPEAGKYTLPPASSTALGGIKIGFQASGKNYPVALDANNKAYVYVPWDPGSYKQPLAQDGIRGGIQIGFQASGKNYPVALSGEKAYVYVPWTADGGNAATVGGHTVGKDVPADADFTNTWRPVQNNLTSQSTTDSLSAYQGYLLANGDARDSTKVNKYIFSVAANRGIRIKYNSMTPVLISAQRSNSGGRLILIGGGYGENHERNDFTELVSSDWFKWCIPRTDSISTSVEIMNGNINGGTIEVWTSGTVETTDISALTSGEQNRRLLTSSNFNDYAPALDGTGAYGSWNINAAQVNGHTVGTDVPAGAVFTDHIYGAGTGLSLANNGTFSIKLAYTTSGKNYKVEADNSGNLFVNVPWENTVYSLPLAQDGVRGGIQIGFRASGKNYPVALSGEKAYVYVPWTADGGNAATVGGHTVGPDVPANADFTNTWRPVQNNLTSQSTTDSLSAYQGYLLANGDARDSTKVKKYIFNVSAGHGLRITYDSMTPILISAQKSLSGGRLIIVGGGYGQNTIRNTFTELVSGNHFTWCIPTVDSISTSVEVLGDSTNGGTIEVWTSGNITTTDITALTSAAQNATLLTSGNYTNYTVTKTGSGASGTWGISITGNADTVDNYHGEDLLTEVDSFKRRLQVRTGSGTLANNTDTYIAFSSPFTTLCSAVIPVSTSGFNAPNALSIVSNNKNGVTLKQNNAMGVSMNVIVLAVGY